MQLASLATPTIAIISDTHLSHGRRFPPACINRLREADAIVHAGDFSTEAALQELRESGPPVYAVHGNVDTPALCQELPLALQLDIDGVSIGIVHDAGPALGRLERMRERFPAVAAVIFGHSHSPLHEMSPHGFQIFNPGSPTQRRRAPTHTMGLARIAAGAIDFRHIHLPEPPAVSKGRRGKA
jgi:putative phosphoesterase